MDVKAGAKFTRKNGNSGNQRDDWQRFAPCERFAELIDRHVMAQAGIPNVRHRRDLATALGTMALYSTAKPDIGKTRAGSTVARLLRQRAMPLGGASLFLVYRT